MGNEAFNQIYQDYARPVFLFLLNISGNYDVAEELTQETFVKAYQNIDRFRGDCRLYVWLCQIGKNLYFNYRRKENRFVGMDSISQAVSPQNVENDAIELHTAREIMDVIEKLPEAYQTVFLYRIFSQLTYAEIGNILSKTEVWARVTYYRAKKMIQDILKEEHSYEM